MVVDKFSATYGKLLWYGDSMDIAAYLKLMTERNASDLFFSNGAPVNIKVEGITSPLGDQPLQPGMVKDIA